MAKLEGLCMGKTCKDKIGKRQMREMKDVEVVEMKPGRYAAKGKCSVCGTGMYKILSKDQAAELKKAA